MSEKIQNHPDFICIHCGSTFGSAFDVEEHEDFCGSLASEFDQDDLGLFSGFGSDPDLSDDEIIELQQEWEKNFLSDLLDPEGQYPDGFYREDYIHLEQPSAEDRAWEAERLGDWERGEALG